MPTTPSIPKQARHSLTRLFSWSPILTLLLLASPLSAAEILIFAAASLTDSLKEIGTHYEKSSGDKLIYHLGASSTLALQIRESAPADVFFSADEAKMNDLAQRNLLLNGTRKSILGNTLVVVAAHNSQIPFHSLNDLKSTRIQKIALAETRSVPAGIYSRTHLEKIRLWNDVVEKVVPTENVRAALAAVEAGNVDIAMIYKTDALISKKVKIIHEITPQDGPEIRYPVAVVRDSKSPEKARRFVEHLSSPEAVRIFQKHGFLIPPTPPQP